MRLRLMSKNNPNSLYVFVKGNKGKGAFEITNSQFEAIHSGIVEDKKIFSPLLMDLNAIIKSLEEIRDNRGKDGFPNQPVIFIFTTYENNYHIAAGLKETEGNKKTAEFKKNYDQLKVAFYRNGVKPHDEVKCYWVPDNFENRIEKVKQLLLDDKKDNNLKP